MFGRGFARVLADSVLERARYGLTHNGTTNTTLEAGTIRRFEFKKSKGISGTLIVTNLR